MKTNASKVLNAYSSFSMKFMNICKGHDISPFIFNLVYHSGDEYKLTLREPLYLREWPYKSGSSNDAVDILVSATERININSMQVVFSNVVVSYYKLEKAQCTLLESFHYDFDVQQPRHPTFHVQSCDGGISNQDFQRRRGTVNCRIVRHENLRIPTAHMSFISVLVCIVADHLNSSQLGDLIKEIKNNADLPRVDSKRIPGIVSSGDFCSYLWYA